MEEIYLFLDESGTDPKELSLMGAISIPKEIYKLGSINQLNKDLRAKRKSFHFTEYSKKDFPLYKDLINCFMEYADLIEVNIVSYKLSNHISNKFECCSDRNKISRKMIYQKIPERVLYGLLRDYGSFTSLKAYIHIENSDQYASRNLDEETKEILNVHSLYRQENYWVKESKLYSKQEHIGIEFTDTILGIVRLIILNNNCLLDHSSRPVHNSKTLWYKQSFIYKMLQDDIFYNFLSNIKYFELDGKNKLANKKFKSYINLFNSDYIARKCLNDKIL